GGVEPLDVDAEAALQDDVPPEGVDARRRGEEEQVAVLMQVDRLADLVREPLEQSDRLNREADVRFVGELVADAAGVAARGPGGEQLLALDEDDVRDAAPSQVIGDARAHAPAANDHHVSGALHGAYCSSCRT